MRQAEYERRLVGAGGTRVAVGVVAVGQQQEAREVAFVGLDTLFENLQSVAFGRQPAADGGVSRETAFGDLGGAARRIVPLDGFELRVGFEEFAALHQGDRVGVDFAQLVEPLAGKGRQHVRDAQFAFADDLRFAAAQQFVILQQTAGDGIFDGDDAQQRSFVPHPFELRLERPAGDDLDRLVAEIAPCGLFVETPRLALNGNLFHP